MKHGINKIHWTGGEPTVANLVEFSDYAKDLRICRAKYYNKWIFN